MVGISKLCSKLAPLLLSLTCVGLSGCLGSGTASTTLITSASGGDTWATFDGGDEGLDGGALEECFSYIEACAEDPYCACFVECLSAESLTPDACLARCHLAEMPYWVQEFEACAGGLIDLGGDSDGQTPDETTSGLTTGVPNETG